MSGNIGANPVWKRYRVLLNRVDTSVSPDFEGQ
ncbi:tail fiber assembly protein [Escherichia coli]|nr:tail fiber assembly protein [Escherichia coli]